MKKEILEQAVLDYINEKFKDKVLDKRVQTFFIYSELVDTVLSFAELLNKNIEVLEKENAELRNQLEHRNCSGCSNHDSNIKLLKAKEIISELVDRLNGFVGHHFYIVDKAEQFLKENE